MSINVTFSEGEKVKRLTTPVYSADYGQTLVVSGIAGLESTVQVDFALNDSSANSITMVGSVTDDVLTVEVPDDMYAYSLNIDYTYHAYIYVVTSTSGTTIREVIVPVKKRAVRTDVQPTETEQTTITSLIAAINDAVDEAEGYADSAATTATTAVSEMIDDTLSITGKVADSKAVGDELSSLSDDITNLENIVNGTTSGETQDITDSAEWTDGYSVYAVDGTPSTNSDYSYADISLGSATHVSGYTRGGSETTQGLAFLDSNGGFVSSDYHEGAGTYDWNYSFDVPDGAVTLRISCVTTRKSQFTCIITLGESDGLVAEVAQLRTDVDNISVETDTTLSVSGKPADAKATGDAISSLASTVSGISGSVATLQSTVNTISNEVYGASAGTQDITNTAVWTDGAGVNYANGLPISSLSACSYADISVVNATQVSGYTRGGLEREKACAFFDSNGTYISGDYNSGGSSYDWNYNLTVPSGAAKFRITCVTAYKDSFTCTATVTSSDGLVSRVENLEELSGTDTTLTVSGKAADAKTVGDKFDTEESGETTSYSGSYYQIRTGNFTAGSVWRIKLVSTTATAQYAEITALTDSADTSTVETQFIAHVGEEVLWSPLKDYEAIKYGVNGSCVLTVNDCSSIYDRLERKVFYCGPSRTYTKLIDAIEAAEQYMGSVLYVDAGTYDLVEEFGSDYFAGITSANSMPGVQLKNRIHIIFSPNSFVTCHYTGSNSYVLRNFSPFNTGQYGFTIENLNLSASRTRYAIHDERNGKAEQCVSHYINCNIKQDNSNNESWSSYCCIGGGLGSNHEVYIENCTFESVAASGIDIHGAVSYHPSNRLSTDFACELVVKDNYFVTGTLDISGSRTDAQNDTTVIVTNNSFEYNVANAESGIYYSGHSEYQGNHYVIRAWNNEIRQ